MGIGLVRRHQGIMGNEGGIQVMLIASERSIVCRKQNAVSFEASIPYFYIFFNMFISHLMKYLCVSLFSFPLIITVLVFSFVILIVFDV